jgi:hypothetical protein
MISIQTSIFYKILKANPKTFNTKTQRKRTMAKKKMAHSHTVPATMIFQGAQLLSIERCIRSRWPHEYSIWIARRKDQIINHLLKKKIH